MPHLLEPPPFLKSPRRRAPWRQRLIDAERGFTLGLRGDGTLFFYMFLNCAVLAIGGVLDLSFVQWLLVGLTVTMVLSLELMQQAVRLFVEEVRPLKPNGHWDQILHLATAAVVLGLIGGSVIVSMVYYHCIRDMFAAG